jgi:hypothetical protein
MTNCYVSADIELIHVVVTGVLADLFAPIKRETTEISILFRPQRVPRESLWPRVNRWLPE